MIKVLSIYGSPHKRGLSSTIHNTFLNKIKDNCLIKKINTYEMDIKPCIGCGHCRSKSICIYKDHMSEVYELFREADLITISWPIYFTSMPGPLKILIDRCQLLWEEVRRGEFPAKKRDLIYFITAGSVYANMYQPSLVVLKHLTNTLDITIDEEKSIKCNNLDNEEGKRTYSEIIFSLSL